VNKHVKYAANDRRYGPRPRILLSLKVQGAQPRSLVSLLKEYSAMDILRKFVQALGELAGIALRLVYPLFVGILLGVVLVPLFLITWIGLKLLFLLVF